MVDAVTEKSDINAASRDVISRSLEIFDEQSKQCNWALLDIYPLTKIYVEWQFIIGIIDTLTSEWQVPTQPPDRAYIVFMQYLSDTQKTFSTQKVIDTIRDLRDQQENGKGFPQTVFLCGQYAPQRPDALSMIVKQAVEIGRDTAQAMAAGKKRAWRFIWAFVAGFVILVGVGVWSLLRFFM